MSTAWPAIAVPVLYIASAAAFITGLKLTARVRAVRRGSALLVTGFLLALAGVLSEPVALESGLIVLGVAIGILGGAWLGVPRRTGNGLGFGAWLSGAGGAAASLLALLVLLGREDWPEPGRLALTGGPRGAVLGLAVVAGVAAMGLGLRAAFGQSVRGHGQAAVVALAASASGLASAMVGLALGNPIVVTVGALVAAAGYALARIVGASLGRRPLDVALGVGAKPAGPEAYREVQACGAEDAAMVLETARKVIVVPGRGMAMAQAQHAVAEVLKLLAQWGAEVRCAIHPAAGLIPGHMNILLDEAKVPADRLIDWQAANAALADADVALVVGANDIVNPGARDDPASAVYGMPFLDVRQARAVFIVKRSLRPGAAGVPNPLFERPNVNLVFGDAKQVLQAIALELKAQRKAAA